jgi:hypothetical protein
MAASREDTDHGRKIDRLWEKETRRVFPFSLTAGKIFKRIGFNQ